MSQYLSTESGAQAQIATNVGWSDFAEWVDTIPLDDYPSLHHLAQFGFDNDPDDVATECEGAIKKHPPDRDVKSVAANVITFARANKAADILIISNGMVEDDGTDAEPPDDSDGADTLEGGSDGKQLQLSERNGWH